MTATANPTATLATVTPVALPTAVLLLGDGHREVTVTVACETVNQHLAITPAVYLSDNGPRFGGGYTITHLPTGRRLHEGVCLSCCRMVAGQLAAIDGINWDTTDVKDAFRGRLTDDTTTVLNAVLDQLDKCAAVSCHERTGY